MTAETRIFITSRTKEKIDKAALAKAQILRGEYDWTGTRWEGKKPNELPRHLDGSPRAPVELLLKAGGWAPTNTSAFKNFSHPYFEERFNYHMQRLDGGFRQALAELTGDGTSLSKLSELTYNSLVADLQDPERAKRIPFKDRAMLYEKVTELDAKLKGDAKTRGQGPKGLNIGSITQIVNQNMDPDDAQRMVEGLNSAHADVVDIIEGVVEVAASDE
jgi:hypothetical protein